jgi:DNA-binding transcriptional ArsR family regulator
LTAPRARVTQPAISKHLKVLERAGLIRFASKAVRDAVIATGMADGAGESYDRLEAVLAGR